MARTPSMEVLSVRRRLAIGGAIGLGLFVLLTVLRGTAALDRPELALVDARTSYFTGTREPDPRIVLAVVDEGDLGKMSDLVGVNTEWPWSPDMQALAVDFLRRAGAKVLLCDFLYFDRGKSIDDLQGTMPADELKKIEALVTAQERDAKLLGQALGAYGKAVVGVFLTDSPTWQTPGRSKLADDRSLPAFGDAGPFSSLGGDGVDLPVGVIFEGARSGGFVNMSPDADGIVRTAVPAGGGGPWSWGSLALMGASLLDEREITVSGNELLLGGSVLPLDGDGRCLLNFRGPAEDTYPFVSVFELVVAGNRAGENDAIAAEDEALAARLRDKLVIWGASFPGAFDVLPSPMSGKHLGPELHATLVDNYLHGDARVYAPGWVNLLILLLCTIGLGIFGAHSRRRFLPHLVSIGAIVGVIGAAFFLFRAGTSIDLFTPVMGCLLASIATSAFRLMTEGRRNKWLESTFQRYLSPDVIESLKDDPSRLELGGVRRNLTIFFSDVAGFTSFTEKLKPEDVVSLLNRYLTGQSEELMGEKAVIDKFEGDAIMAFFGDPLEMIDHPVRACRAAVKCMNALPKLEPVWRELGLERFEIRIGLNSGPALVGNMGSEARFDYTCMGDTVNLASRLEGANKAFGSKIMIGDETFEGAKDAVLAKPLAHLVVKGKTQAVPVYELIAMADDASEAERTHVAAFARAHAAVLADDLAAARSALGEAESARPGDGPCAWLTGLIGEIESGALARPWDGRVVLDRK